MMTISLDSYLHSPGLSSKIGMITPKLSSDVFWYSYMGIKSLETGEEEMSVY